MVPAIPTAPALAGVSAPSELSTPVDLSVLIPALDEADNLAILLPRLIGSAAL